MISNSNTAPIEILICDRFAFEAQIELAQNKNFHVQTYSTPPSLILHHEAEKLMKAQALIIRSKFFITSELLDKTPQLKLIVTCTSGFEHIDLNETQKRNICVMFTPEANTIAAAELTWGLLLACNRSIAAAHTTLKKGIWMREPFLGTELAHKTLGIVGLGRIGKKVAQYANAFGMNVLAFDPYVEAMAFTESKAARVSYEEILKQSDFLSFHVPSTKETQNMFSQSQIECVHPDLILINTSRGSVVNEEDLIKALQDQKIKFAALDVFAKEPLAQNSKLLSCPNLILTPHLGAYTKEAFLRASFEASRYVEDFFKNNKTQNTLPLKNDWGRLSFSERT